MKKIHQKIFPIAIISLLISCNNSNNKTVNSENNELISQTYEAGTFGYDTGFLNQYDSIVILKNDSAMVAVSPKYQAKVFTSTAGGNTGHSFGWINYEAFDGPLDPHMNAYGGENRFWLGPEGGKFSLYFEPGKEMVFENWKTPAPFDSESWNIISQSKDEVQLQKQMQLKNYAGTSLSLQANRTISILSGNEIENKTGISLPEAINAVGYRTENAIKNTGNFAWNEETGMPAIWMLDMFNPSPRTTIVIPYKDAPDMKDKIATTDYFGEIPPERVKFIDGVLYFKADGKQRGKLGLSPERAKPVAGSWDAANNILTIIMFDLSPEAKYLNQEWNTSKPVFSGDAVNAYNDGPLEDGSQLGPFYELESVSPAAFLKPGETLSHNHWVFHFTGDKDQLNEITQQTLGITLSQIESAFQ